MIWLSIQPEGLPKNKRRKYKNYSDKDHKTIEFIASDVKMMFLASFPHIIQNLQFMQIKNISVLMDGGDMALMLEQASNNFQINIVSGQYVIMEHLFQLQNRSFQMGFGLKIMQLALFHKKKRQFFQHQALFMQVTLDMQRFKCMVICISKLRYKQEQITNQLQGNLAQSKILLNHVKNLLILIIKIIISYSGSLCGIILETLKLRMVFQYMVQWHESFLKILDFITRMSGGNKVEKDLNGINIKKVDDQNNSLYLDLILYFEIFQKKSFETYMKQQLILKVKFKDQNEGIKSKDNKFKFMLRLRKYQNFQCQKQIKRLHQKDLKNQKPKNKKNNIQLLNNMQLLIVLPYVVIISIQKINNIGKGQQNMKIQEQVKYQNVKYTLIFIELDNYKMGTNETKITYFDGSQYFGQVNKEGKEHGNGRILYANKDQLTGTFENGDCVDGLILYKNSNSYKGQLKNGKYEGNGTLVTKTEKKTGVFKQGKFIKGIVQFENGSIYEGSIQNGKKNGNGTIKFHDGSSYQGNFLDDQFEGTGTLTLADGSIYKGTFKKGKQDGEGELTKVQDEKIILHYVGHFKDGEFDGEGKATYQNHDIYEGQFKNGLKNGFGKYTYRNGDQYIGRFEQDLKTDRKCKFLFKSGSSYEGGILNGKYHGNGKLTSKTGQFYEGQFEEGLKHGEGVLSSLDGIYTGHFKKDLKDGKGKMVFTNGDIFQGSFYEGQKHGEGHTKGSNYNLICDYQYGVKSGKYKLTSGDDDYSEEGIYANGLRHGDITIKKGGIVVVNHYDNGTKIDD